MTSATNRTDRLAKALKACRPDFTLHNARVFARAVIEAPDRVFGEKPLRFLPKGHHVQATESPEASAAGRSQSGTGVPEDPHSMFLGRGRYLEYLLGAAVGRVPGRSDGLQGAPSANQDLASAYSALPPGSGIRGDVPDSEGVVAEPPPINDSLTALIAHCIIGATDWRSVPLELADRIRDEFVVTERRTQEPPARAVPGWYQRVARDWAAARFGFPLHPAGRQVHVAVDGSEWTYELVAAGQWDISGSP